MLVVQVELLFVFDCSKFPVVPGLDKKLGVPALFEIKTPPAVFVICPTTLIELAHNIPLAVTVAGHTEVDQIGAVLEPDCSIWPAVAVPARIAPADALL